MRWTHWLARLLLALLLLAPLPDPARASPAGCAAGAVDLMLVLDDSGSMAASDDERNDPDNLRITATHLMVDLLDPGDRVGLVLFSDRLRAVSPLTPVEAGAAALHSAVNQFESKGGTRLDLALQAGLDQLSPGTGRTSAVLFLTDGRPDSDAAGQAARLAALAKQARKAGVQLYVIGLGPNYDRTLLEQVTALSNSQQLWHVVQPDHLGTAFLEILRNLKGLNIETSTAGQVPVLGLSPEVRFAALRPRGEAGATVDWNGGALHQRAAAAEMPAGVAYSYDLLVYKPSAPGPGEARSGARVIWKIERPPVEARVIAPGSREEVDSGEAVPVKVQLLPCGGADLPAGLKGRATLLDADRRPMPYQADLSGTEPGLLTGQLVMPPEAGTYVLNVRVMTAEGRQVTVAEQTVAAVPRSRWSVEAPAALAQGAEGTVTVRHRFGGKPSPGGLEALTATLPDGSTQTVTLSETETGAWTGRLTAPPDQTGSITWALGETRAETRVEPVKLVVKDPGPLTWSFLDAWQGLPVTLNLQGETTGPVAAPQVLPPLVNAKDGPVHLTTGPWVADGNAYRTQATLTLAEKATWRDLFLPRPVELQPASAPGPYLAVEAPVLQGRLAPLLPWYRLLFIALVLGLLTWLVRNRLYGGPQLPLLAGGVYLNARRPGVWARLLSVKAQREITVGGLQSKAAVKLADLPADAMVRITARGVPGRERFRLENLNRSLPLIYKDLFQRNRIALKGRGPAPLITLGGVPLNLVLHPGSKHLTRR